MPASSWQRFKYLASSIKERKRASGGQVPPPLPPEADQIRILASPGTMLLLNDDGELVEVQMTAHWYPLNQPGSRRKRKRRLQNLFRRTR